MRARHGELRAFLEETVFAWSWSDCLIWPFRLEPSGYPAITINGRKRRVNRLVCEATHGAPEFANHEAAHSCGNKACVSPLHLRWATPKENSRDKFTHGTMIRGENVNGVKLDQEKVIKIREMRAKGVPAKIIARTFGVHPGHVYDIGYRKVWAWLP